MIIYAGYCKCKVVFRVLRLYPLYDGLTTYTFTYRTLFCRKMTPASEVYLQIKENSEKFSMYFLYHMEELKIKKELHFHRNLSEPVHVLLNRISLKINPVPKKSKKLMTPDGIENKTSIPVQIIKNGSPVANDVICKEILKTEENSNIFLKIGDKHYNILVNRPWIENIKLPKSIMAGFAVYPRKLKGFFMNENESEFLWFKKISGNYPENPIASGCVYIPSIEDVGCELKLRCTPILNGLKGLSVETCSTYVEAGPGPCPFENRHVFTKNSLSGNSFRIVSYNILADLYASSVTGKQGLFYYCSPYALTIDYRKLLILNELIGYKADVICLQEVDCQIFENDLKTVLQVHGMEGIFTKKGGQVREGIACFYNKLRFKLVSNHNLILGEESCSETYLKHIWDNIVKNESVNCQLKERTTAVQILIFDYLDKPKHKLIVGNTHLYFHPKADHIRLLQAGMCLNFVNKIVNNLKLEEPECTISVLFCGDFNSTPECGVFKLFTSNHIPEDYHEWKNEDESVVGLSLYNPIKFDSACGTPEFTNYTDLFKGCLDYIFYQTDFLKVEQVIPFPLEEELSRFTAIPSIVFPSDHIALIADFLWK